MDNQYTPHKSTQPSLLESSPMVERFGDPSIQQDDAQLIFTYDLVRISVPLGLSASIRIGSTSSCPHIVLVYACHSSKAGVECFQRFGQWRWRRRSDLTQKWYKSTLKTAGPRWLNVSKDVFRRR